METRSGLTGIQGHGMPRFCELAAIGLQEQRQVCIFERPVSQGLLQQDLARCRGQEIAAADDFRDALQFVVHDHRKVVGKKTIPAPDHEVSASLPAFLPDRSLEPVIEIDDRGAAVRPESQRMRAQGGRWIVPAGSRINRFLAWLQGLRRKLRAAAAAGVAKVRSPQSGQRLFVADNSITLEFYISIPLKSEGFQDLKHLIRDAGDHPVTVEVFDT